MNCIVVVVVGVVVIIAASSVGLVNGIDVVVEAVIDLDTGAMTKSDEIENVADQTYECRYKHYFGIDLVVLWKEDPVSCLNRQPCDHCPDN